MGLSENKVAVSSLGTIMSIWAHPDDETLSCAGIMAQAVRNGQRVVCITATRGEAGSQDQERWPPEVLGKIRSVELAAALKIIGVKDHHWLNYRDGTCQAQNKKEAQDVISAFIQKYKPSTILTFGPEGLTGHPDHQAVSQWVTGAVDTLNEKPAVYHAVIAKEQYECYLHEMDQKLNVFFNISSPPIMPLPECNLTFRCDKAEMCELKRSAIAAMPSQTAVMFDAFGEEFIDSAFMYEAFVRAL